jgi:hypothetical protein
MLILWAVIFVVAAGQNLYRTLIIIDVAAAARRCLLCVAECRGGIQEIMARALEKF